MDREEKPLGGVRLGVAVRKIIYLATQDSGRPLLYKHVCRSRRLCVRIFTLSEFTPLFAVNHSLWYRHTVLDMVDIIRGSGRCLPKKGKKKWF